MLFMKIMKNQCTANIKTSRSNKRSNDMFGILSGAQIFHISVLEFGFL